MPNTKSIDCTINQYRGRKGPKLFDALPDCPARRWLLAVSLLARLYLVPDFFFRTFQWVVINMGVEKSNSTLNSQCGQQTDCDWTVEIQECQNGRQECQSDRKLPSFTNQLIHTRQEKHRGQRGTA
jgi:hypothetical protein